MRPVGLPLRESVSSLCRGHANLLCIVPIFSYVTPKGTLCEGGTMEQSSEFCFLLNSRVSGNDRDRRPMLSLCPALLAVPACPNGSGSTASLVTDPL